MPCRFPGPPPWGKVRGIWPGGSPGPHPKGKLRGIWPGGISRPTPKGEVEGDLMGGLQDHTWGGLSEHALRQTPHSCSYIVFPLRFIRKFISMVSMCTPKYFHMVHFTDDTLNSISRSFISWERIFHVDSQAFTYYSYIVFPLLPHLSSLPSICISTDNKRQQECIPVGCVPPAC